MQNILRNISFCFKYISGIVGGGVAPIHPPPGMMSVREMAW